MTVRIGDCLYTNDKRGYRYYFYIKNHDAQYQKYDTI